MWPAAVTDIYSRLIQIVVMSPPPMIHLTSSSRLQCVIIRTLLRNYPRHKMESRMLNHFPAAPARKSRLPGLCLLVNLLISSNKIWFNPPPPAPSAPLPGIKYPAKTSSVRPFPLAWADWGLAWRKLSPRHSLLASHAA